MTDKDVAGRRTFRPDPDLGVLWGRFFRQLTGTWGCSSNFGRGLPRRALRAVWAWMGKGPV